MLLDHDDNRSAASSDRTLNTEIPMAPHDLWVDAVATPSALYDSHELRRRHSAEQPGTVS